MKMIQIFRCIAGALASFALVGLTGCGVQPTDIIDAGEPAIGVSAGPRVYFLHDTSLRDIQRTTGRLGSLQAALDSLAEGPTPAERDQGMTTQIPAGKLHLDLSTGNYLVVAPSTSSPLSKAGMGQIVCTVAAWQSARHGDHLAETQVSIANGQHEFGPYTCPNFLTTSTNSAGSTASP